MKLFTNNWSLKLMSLVLAVALWSHVRGEVNPWEEATFRVPLRVEPPDEMVVVNSERLPKTVKVTVRAPRLTLRQIKGSTPANPLAPLEEATLLTNGQIEARLDFAIVNKGQQKTAVEASSRIDDIQVISVNPDYIAVMLDEAMSKRFDVEPRLNSTRSGRFRLEDASVEPEQAQVLGLSSEVARVAAVRTQVGAQQLSRDKAATLSVPLVAVDKDGQIVEAVRIAPAFAELEATLHEEEIIRRVRVRVRTSGVPAPGYRVGAVTVEPARLPLRGTQSVLDTLASLPAPVSLEGLSIPIRRRVRVPLPPGVTPLASNRVTVVVNIVRENAPSTSGDEAVTNQSNANEATEGRDAAPTTRPAAPAPTVPSAPTIRARSTPGVDGRKAAPPSLPAPASSGQ